MLAHSKKMLAHSNKEIDLGLWKDAKELANLEKIFYPLSKISIGKVYESLLEFKDSYADRRKSWKKTKGTSSSRRRKKENPSS